MSYLRTPEHRRLRAKLIHRWKPWEQSTGPRTAAGKARVSRNGFKGGHRAMLRELRAALRKQGEALKRIEWTKTPEEAFQKALYFNNKYELDGRDPNGFTGVAWCFGKHDRPWGERPIFGQVRYMNDKGLKRKFDADAYVKRMSQLKENKGNKIFCNTLVL